MVLETQDVRLIGLNEDISLAGLFAFKIGIILAFLQTWGHVEVVQDALNMPRSSTKAFWPSSFRKVGGGISDGVFLFEEADYTSEARHRPNRYLDQ